MNQITTIPFMFEDERLRINDKPVLVPSNNTVGLVSKSQAYTMLNGKFTSKEDLLDTLNYIGLDINPEYLDIDTYTIQFIEPDDGIQITIMDSYKSNCYVENSLISTI